MGQIAQIMSVSESALRKKVRTVKTNLLAYAHLLPFKATINHSNVSSYARTLIRITMLPRRTPETASLAQKGEGDAVPKQIMAVDHAGNTRDSIQSGNVSEISIKKKKKKRSSENMIVSMSSPVIPGPLAQGKQGEIRETLARKTCEGSKHPGSIEPSSLELEDNETSQINLGTMHDETEINECISDSELDQYIRSPEEVRLYQKLYDAQNL